MSDELTAINQDGTPEPACDFHYPEDDAVEPDSNLSDFCQEDLDRAICGLRSLLQWIYQNGSNNPDGVKIRAIIACWIFLKELRVHPLTKMARGYGLDKQSLGRWHDDFKKQFPHIKTPHMKSK
jgi:hypothetical protein